MRRSFEFVAVALKPATVPEVPVMAATVVAPSAKAASLRSDPSEGNAPTKILLLVEMPFAIAHLPLVSIPDGAVQFDNAGVSTFITAACHVAPFFAKRYDDVPEWAHKMVP